jgi:hypothetical protein
MSVHIVVAYADHQTGYYPVPEDEGWKIDTAKRCLVIGHGVPRTYVPLDGVQHFTVEPCEAREVPITDPDPTHVFRRCWRGECRNGCAYPGVCALVSSDPQPPDPRHEGEST